MADAVQLQSSQASTASSRLSMQAETDRGNVNATRFTRDEVGQILDSYLTSMAAGLLENGLMEQIDDPDDAMQLNSAPLLKWVTKDGQAGEAKIMKRTGNGNFSAVSVEEYVTEELSAEGKTFNPIRLLRAIPKATPKYYELDKTLPSLLKGLGLEVDDDILIAFAAAHVDKAAAIQRANAAHEQG